MNETGAAYNSACSATTVSLLAAAGFLLVALVVFLTLHQINAASQ